MNYVSTRDKSVKVTAAAAIAAGISAEGGLFVPDTFPHFRKVISAGLKSLIILKGQNTF